MKSGFIDRDGLVMDHLHVDVESVLIHENVVHERLDGFIAYLKSLEPYRIIPSILVCSKTMALIDGHHRLSAIKKLGLGKCPVTLIDYSHRDIIADLDGKISKEEIVSAALSGNLLPPKSSFHHVIDANNIPRPILLLSRLSDLR